jgi:hypothetical protein
MITKIENVVPEKNIIVLSPHYDDVPLTFGGYLDSINKHRFLQTKKIRIVSVFSFSNFMTRDDDGNKDISKKRIQYVTGIRIMEDIECMDELIGRENYTYEIKGENECLLRQKEAIFDGPIEFLSGNKDSFEEQDWQVYHRLKTYAHVWLTSEDTAVFLPLGMKEHIDHIVLREAVMDARDELGSGMKSILYLGEDQPYTGLADDGDWGKAMAFLKGLSHTSLNYCIDEKRKADLAMKYYVSQAEDSYKEGVLKRAAQLQQKFKVDCGVERMYRLV